MLLFNKLTQLYFAPVDIKSEGIITPTGPMGKEDTIDFLKSDDTDIDDETIDLDTDEPPKSKNKKDDKKDEKKLEDEDEDNETEEDDELKELEEELNEDEEVDELDDEITAPVSRREILKAYPDLFKKFPYLEHAIYKEREFTELFGTMKDAKEAAEDAETLHKFEEDLLSGNTQTTLELIKRERPNEFNKVVDNYLGTLQKVDKEAYHHVIGNVVKHTILGMISEGEASSNDQLKIAAQIVNQFVFGSSKFTPPQALHRPDADKPDEKQIKLDERERNFARREFERAKETLDTKINNTFKSTITAQIDPKESMTEYIRNTATREALENLEHLMSKDNRFNIIVEKLWERAAANNYDSKSMEKLKIAFTSKARTLLPSVIKKARNEALRGMGKRVRDEEERTPSTRKSSSNNRKEQNEDEPQSRNSRGKVPEGMSTLEFLMSDD